MPIILYLSKYTYVTNKPISYYTGKYLYYRILQTPALCLALMFVNNGKLVFYFI